jgi:2-dehydropantoate 2-reductase
MKTAIIGAGAMGALFGGLLAESGNEVWLVDVWEAHVRAIVEAGLQIEREGTTRRIEVHATTDPSEIGAVELVIVFVKANQTRIAARTAAGLLGTDSRVLTLQNGMGNADVIAEIIEPGRVVAGTTAHGATVLGPGHIRHAGVGPTAIGMWHSGDIEPAQGIAAGLNAAGIETTVASNIRRVVWEKLLVNVGINAITALTGVKNGQLLDLAVTRELCRAAVQEGLEVARALGIEVRSDAPDHVLQVARATASNRSSMGQDVDHRRPTEIDAINGVVVREARKAGLHAPVNQTLTALVATLQSHYEK